MKEQRPCVKAEVDIGVHSRRGPCLQIQFRLHGRTSSQVEKKKMSAAHVNQAFELIFSSCSE